MKNNQTINRAQQDLVVEYGLKSDVSGDKPRQRTGNSEDFGLIDKFISPRSRSIGYETNLYVSTVLLLLLQSCSGHQLDAIINRQPTGWLPESTLTCFP